MRLEIFVVTFALCSELLCSSLQNRKRKPARKNFNAHYSLEEEQFIIQQLKALGRTYSSSTWTTIVKEHRKRLNTGSPGFKQERTPMGLNQHFNVMMQRNGLLEVPNSVREIVKNPVYKFSPEENELILKELLCFDGTPVQSRQLWKDIVQKIELKRQAGQTGFVLKRTVEGIKKHVGLIMKRNGMLPEAVLNKFPQLFRVKKGGFCKRSPKVKKRCVPSLKEDVTDTISQDKGEGHQECIEREDDKNKNGSTLMIEELVQAPGKDEEDWNSFIEEIGNSLVNVDGTTRLDLRAFTSVVLKEFKSTGN